MSRLAAADSKLPAQLSATAVTCSAACCGAVSSMQGVAAACGVLATLASLFKLSKREEVVEYAPTVLRSLKTCNCLNSTTTLIRKLSIKLAQVREEVLLYH